jgi:hypothetical protein
MSGSRWKAVLAAALIFVFGIAVGTLGTLGVGQAMLRHALSAPADAPGPLDRTAARIESRLTSHLNLDAGQAAQLHTELQETTHDLKVIRADTAHRIQSTLSAAVVRIGAGLRPEQRTELYRVAEIRMGRIGLIFTPPAP